MLLVAIAASTLITIYFRYRGPRIGLYLFKPLTMLLIITLFFIQAGLSLNSYACLILVGLLCSLAGDIFLMLPKDRFLPGLISFFLAHLAYIAAFTMNGGFGITIPATPLLMLYGLFLLIVLWNHVGTLKIPVVFYAIAIVTMASQAIHSTEGDITRPAALGALLFVASDSCLAWNRFKRPFKSAEFFILSTYFAAQTLIALSVTLSK